MAQKDNRKHPGVPAKNHGNRVDPAVAGKLPLPPNYKATYGVGNTGKGGDSVAAKDGGNRRSPSLANQLPLPSNHDTYAGNGGK